MSTKFNFLHIFLQVKKVLCLNILSSYQFASMTKAFFSDRNFCLWLKFSASETFYSVTELCFLDGNLDRNLSIIQNLFFKDIFFSYRKFCLTESFFCYSNLLLGQKLVLSKILLFDHFLRYFEGKVLLRNGRLRYLA